MLRVDTDTFHTELQSVRGHLVSEYGLEVSSVDSYHDMIKAVSIYRSAKIHWHEKLSSFGSQFDSIHGNATLFNSIGDIELIERLHSIGGNSDPESNRPQFICSFVHYRVESRI
ncbi:hypothetical protein GCM10008985_28190 [Halococcus dombrowskii]|uniref:Uncharacterized protein n=1 Tax=Halococcus dombrowskii TaxID=179637 RepID=A0AAV3SJB6_HALDO